VSLRPSEASGSGTRGRGASTKGLHSHLVVLVVPPIGPRGKVVERLEASGAKRGRCCRDGDAGQHWRGIRR
jgi:hypothetical protein